MSTASPASAASAAEVEYVEEPTHRRLTPEIGRSVRRVRQLAKVRSRVHEEQVAALPCVLTSRVDPSRVALADHSLS